MKHVLCVVTVAIFSSVWANAQTIADIARQERAKRQATQKAVVITNETLGIKPSQGTEVKQDTEPKAEGTPAATASPAAPGAAVSAPAQAPAQPAAQTEARDEKWWRAKYEEARTEVRRAENQAAVAQLELNSANRDFLTRSYDPDGRGPAAVAAATKRLAETNAAVAAARAKVAGLDEELRRAGAPAGWAR
jgi:hypothetical protein